MGREIKCSVLLLLISVDAAGMRLATHQSTAARHYDPHHARHATSDFGRSQLSTPFVCACCREEQSERLAEMLKGHQAEYEHLQTAFKQANVQVGGLRAIIVQMM